MRRGARGAVVALAALAACRSQDKNAKRPTPPVPVRVQPAALVDAPLTVAASGVVEPMQTVSVEAQATGSVLEVAFRQGDWVDSGQVLFRLDPAPLQDAVAQARAALARDEAQASAARHDAERYTALAAESYVTKSQAEQMRATALAQEASVVADRAALRIAQRNLGYASIRAPISGRTGSVLLRRGDLVGPQTGPLVVINQLRPILVRFPVLAGDFDLLRGAVATHALPVTATSGDSANVTERGTLNFLDNAIDSLTGTVTGRAVFSNASARMWPGQLVFLSVEAGVQRGVVAVPTQAIQTGQQGAFVYVVDRQKNTAATRSVAAGRAVGDLTIVARGLAVGEQVVTDGQSRLSQGSRVAIIPAAGGDTARGMNVAGGTTTGAVGGEVVTGPAGTGTGAGGGGAGITGGAGAGGGTGGGGAGGGAGGVSTGAMSTEGGSGVAASGGRGSPYSGASSSTGQASSVTQAPNGAAQGVAGGTVAPLGMPGVTGGAAGMSGGVRGAPATSTTSPAASGSTSPAGVVRPTSPTTSAAPAAPAGRP